MIVDDFNTHRIGVVRVQMDFTYDGGGLGKGGCAALSVERSNVAEVRLDNRTQRRRSDDGCNSQPGAVSAVGSSQYD